VSTKEVPPMPHVLSYDEKTALVVVDVQNDFADPGGSLYVRDGEQTIPFINEQTARARGALVVYTQDWHPASTRISPRTAGCGRCTA
jgi:nicotinamidase/pyrazinamidase